MDDKSSTLKETLEAIDHLIVRKKAAIRRGEGLARLKKDPAFVDVILNGYIKTEELRLFNILTDPSGASPHSNEEILSRLSSIMDLKRYIGTEDFPGTVKMEADNAPAEIDREELFRKEATQQFANSEG